MKRTRKKTISPRPALPIRLVHIPAAVDSDGEPRVAVEVLNGPGGLCRRLMICASFAAAVDLKRSLEGQR